MLKTMRYYNFNPFDKDIKDIEAADLAVLTDVCEGWYIDYKQKIIDLKKIAKHASAFANQYGGWLFFGIKESAEQTAGDFIGIKKEEVQRLSTAIREAVTVHSNPAIYYEENVVYGPNGTINLSENKAIYILYIPEGNHPPYIHSSGKIYRRVSAQSDPKAETDRHVLDTLWEKNQKSNERLNNFLENRTSYKIVNPIAYIHLLTDPYFERDFEFLKFKDFRESLTKTKSGGISIPMNTFYSAKGGYIARQTKGNNPLFPVVSFRWWQSGAALLTIPFNYYDNKDLMKRYPDSENARAFIEETERQELDHAKVCDLNDFLFSLAGMYNQFQQLKEITNNSENVYAAITIENTFLALSFIDDTYYVNRIRKYGIPLVEDKQIKIPELAKLNTLIKIGEKEKASKGDAARKETVNAIVDVLAIAGPVLFAFGGLNESKEITKFKSIFGLSKFVKP